MTGEISVLTVARYSADGALDTNFGTSGFIHTQVGASTMSTGMGMVVESGDSILIAGTVQALYSTSYGTFGSDAVLKRIVP
ncbi:MAG TPA: hypothetical protein VNJ08_04315 [Bacteriovoracaceae bacterium]|nr:hypothetical protein [Bacteriovoracaceae bacterium]